MSSHNHTHILNSGLVLPPSLDYQSLLGPTDSPNPLNPLPLVDGCLFVDNSGWMESITTCPRALEYKQLYKRIIADSAIALNFGSSIHLALEHRYRKYKHLPVAETFYDEIAPQLSSFFEQNPGPEGDYRTLNWAIEVIKRYNERYTTEDFQIFVDDKNEPVVELPFGVPLFEYKIMTERLKKQLGRDTIVVIFTGRIDLPIVVNGKTFIMDHKTTSMLGDSFFSGMRLAAQQRGYGWAFETLTGTKVHGYRINAVRVKEPPLYVTQGKPSRAGTKTSPTQWWEESLQRETYYFNSNELVEWKHNTIANLEEFFWHYERGHMPQRTTHCVSKYGKCNYFDVCSLEPADRAMYLASGLFKDNTWNPLKDVSQAKQ